MPEHLPGERRQKKLEGSKLWSPTAWTRPRMGHRHSHSLPCSSSQPTPFHASLAVSLPLELDDGTDNEEGPPEAPKAELADDELRHLLGKGSYPVFLDLSGKEYALTADSFLLLCPDIIKELDLSNNKLEYLDNLAHMSRLKRLRANNNCLYSAGLIQLSSLVLLSLAHNRMEMLCGMEYLHNLVNLNLSDNLISGGFSELGKLKALQVLNLSYNNIALTFNKFHHKILRHLQSLPKLRYLYFNGNPVQQSIFKYRFFVISQLPKLHFLDGDPVTKEERKKAKKLDEKLWHIDLVVPKQAAAEQSVPKKADQRVEQRPCFIEGDPARMARINEYRMLELGSDAGQQPLVISVTALIAATPVVAGAEPTKKASKGYKEWKERDKRVKASKRKTWDSARLVHFGGRVDSAAIHRWQRDRRPLSSPSRNPNTTRRAKVTAKTAAMKERRRMRESARQACR